MYNLELEWIVGCIRIGGPDYHGKHTQGGAKYDFVVSVLRKGDEAFLYGAAGQFDRAMYRLIKERLTEQGVKLITWEKLNNEKARSFAVETEASRPGREL